MASTVQAKANSMDHDQTAPTVHVFATLSHHLDTVLSRQMTCLSQDSNGKKLKCPNNI